MQRVAEPTESGWFFSGRRDIGRALVQWLERRDGADAQNLFVLTGSGGTGKSAAASEMAGFPFSRTLVIAVSLAI